MAFWHGHKKRSSGQPANFRDADLRKSLLNARPVEWQENVELQADQVVQQVHAAMAQAKPLAAPTAKKPYFTEEIWTLRLRKLQHRQINKRLRRGLAREALQNCFLAWRSGRPPPYQEEIFQYGSTLPCAQIKSMMGFYKLRTIMKHILQKSKQAFLSPRLEQLSPHTPASTVLAEIRPLAQRIPKNKNEVRSTLPLIHSAQDQPCTLPNEALEVWVNFFSDMEGGMHVDRNQLRAQWLEALREHSREHLHIEAEQVPTLTVLEIALRRVPCKEARGPDEVPGEVCHFNAGLLAPLCYTQMLKVLLHGQEPLLCKGGLLTPAYKGKGLTHQVSSFRSLLVSSHLGKVVHRCLRQHSAETYEHFLQAQQLGGRRKVPVQLALHQARAFLRRARHHCHSAGLPFLDPTEAFYRILRELSLGGVPTDALVCHVFQKLQLPQDSIQQLHTLLDEGTALEQAGLSSTARNCFSTINRNTHLWLPGQNDVVATSLETRPGDSFADVILGFTWGLVLKKSEVYLKDSSLIACFEAPRGTPFFPTAKR